MIRHEFEEDDTGDELTLNPDLTYEVVTSFVDIEDGDLVFTHRVRLGRYQFEVIDGEPQDLGRIRVIDTQPDEIEIPPDVNPETGVDD